MTLKACSVHKATADGNVSHEYNNSIMNDIESECDTAVNEDPPKYDVHLQYTINGLGVKQPDTTYVELDATIAALRAAGYIVSYKAQFGILKLHLRME